MCKLLDFFFELLHVFRASDLFTFEQSHRSSGNTEFAFGQLTVLRDESVFVRRWNFFYIALVDINLVEDVRHKLLVLLIVLYDLRCGEGIVIDPAWRRLEFFKGIQDEEMRFTLCRVA